MRMIKKLTLAIAVATFLSGAAIAQTTPPSPDTPAAGETFANPDLAATLRAIAADGPAAFYEGAPAKAAAYRTIGSKWCRSDGKSLLDPGFRRMTIER